MTVDLSVRCLGLDLPHPLIVGASPLTDHLDMVKRLEDAGAAALVMRSLFEEQITAEQLAAMRHYERHTEAHPEAQSYAPDLPVFALGTEQYLEQLARIKQAVRIPVVASLNGVTTGGWIQYAKWMEEAGASALEVNLYSLPSDPEDEPTAVEARLIELVRQVTLSIQIPVSVKISQFYSSIPAFLRKLETAGAKGAVLFNRFYQPDIDVENLQIDRALHLSTSAELNLRLQWLAIVSPQTKLTMFASGGIHEPIDVVKAILAGAHGVQTVSALLRKGPSHLSALIRGLRTWMEAHEYESVSAMRGSMNLARCPDPEAWLRANYMHLLQGWHSGADA